MEETTQRLGIGLLTSIQLHYQQYLRNLVDVLNEIQWNSNALPFGAEPNPEDLNRLRAKFQIIFEGLQQIEELLRGLPETFPSESERKNELENHVDKQGYAEKALLEEQTLLKSRMEQFQSVLKQLTTDLYSEDPPQDVEENFLI